MIAYFAEILMIFQIFFVTIPWTGTESSVNHRHRFSKSLRRFSHPFFQKIYPQSLAKCASRRCRQQREKYTALRQGQSVSCQSKILPRCHNSPFAHSAPSESCWGSHSPNPALPLWGKEKRLNRICKQSVNFSKRGVRFLPIFLEVYEEVFTRARYVRRYFKQHG